MARAELQRKGVVPKVTPSGPCPQQIKTMRVSRPGKKEQLVVHRVHPEHSACNAFVELTNAEMATVLYSTQERARAPSCTERSRRR